MSSRLLRMSLGVVLSLSFAAAACDRPSDITSPDSSLVPQLSLDKGNGNAFALGQKDLKAVRVDVSATGYNMCEFGPKGGICAVNGATLYVPAHTVEKHTFFTVNLSVGPNVVVDVQATSADCWSHTSSSCPLNNVGAAGFKNPLTLTVSKFGLTSSGLVVAWNKSGSLIGQPTTDLGDSVSAQITHFSEYILSEYILAEK